MERVYEKMRTGEWANAFDLLFDVGTADRSGRLRIRVHHEWLAVVDKNVLVEMLDELIAVSANEHIAIVASLVECWHEIALEKDRKFLKERN